MRWRFPTVVLVSAIAGALIAGSAASTTAPIVYSVSLTGRISEEGEQRGTEVRGDCTWEVFASWRTTARFASRTPTRVTVRSRSGRPHFPPAELRSIGGTITSNGISAERPQTPGCGTASHGDCLLRERRFSNARSSLRARAQRLSLGPLRDPVARGRCGSPESFGRPDTDLNLAPGRVRLARLTSGVELLRVRGSYSRTTTLGPGGGNQQGTLEAAVEWTLTFRRVR